MVLGKLPVPGRPTLIWIIVGSGPTTLAVGARGGCLDIFSSIIFLLSPSIWDGPIYIEILFQRAIKSQTTNQCLISESKLLHTKFHGNRASGSEKDKLGGFTIFGH